MEVYWRIHLVLTSLISVVHLKLWVIAFLKFAIACKTLAVSLRIACTEGEPGCTIPTDWERYPDYLELLEDCIAQTQYLNDSPDPDATFKIKVTSDGQIQHEPRLKAKKYRRVSRRSRKQTLQELQQEFTGSLDKLEAMESEDWEE